MIDPKDAQHLARAAASAQALHVAMAGIRLQLAGQLQLAILSLYWGEQEAPVLDDRRTAKMIADAAVLHADALIEAAGRTPSAADGLLRR